MIINRDSRQIGGLLPEAVIMLSSVLAVPLYHTARTDKIRHPLGAYNISLQSILANFELALQELSALVQDPS